MTPSLSLCAGHADIFPDTFRCLTFLCFDSNMLLQHKRIIIFEIFLSFTNFFPLFYSSGFLFKEEVLLQDIVSGER